MVSSRLPVLFLILLSAHTVNGVSPILEIGTDVCECSPGRYRMLFNFSQPACEPQGFDIPGGIESTECFVGPWSDSCTLTDETPLYVNHLELVESSWGGYSLNNREFYFEEGRAFEGATIQYTTIAGSSPFYKDEAEELTKEIYIEVGGFNQFGEEIFHYIRMTFTNNCSVYPVMLDGAKLGWFQFERVYTAPWRFCPLAAPTSHPTTLTPTLEPTLAPTTAPTFSPTVAPTFAANERLAASNPAISPLGDGTETPAAPTDSPSKATSCVSGGWLLLLFPLVFGCLFI